jgi:hypothetical protein
MRGKGSTNIRDGKVKKYMFSLENLAWRTSDKPGFTVQDLPECERGPNGGRIMWFPPYDLSFSEDTKASWNPTKFLGRPEPIYTYQNSSRSGSISWRIVVDHPSALNTIIEKQLANKSDQEINSIVDSFFAGCVKYDLYDLAAKYNQIPISELYTYQEILNDARTTAEEVNQILNEISKQKERKDQNQNGGDGTFYEDDSSIEVLQPERQSLNIRLYFENTEPDSTNRNTDIIASNAYDFYYKQLIDAKSNYNSNKKNSTNKLCDTCTPTSYPKEGVVNFFPTEIEFGYNEFNGLLKNLGETLSNGGEVELGFKATTNSLGSDEYNRALAKRRYDSVLK